MWLLICGKAITMLGSILVIRHQCEPTTCISLSPTKSYVLGCLVFSFEVGRLMVYHIPGSPEITYILGFYVPIHRGCLGTSFCSPYSSILISLLLTFDFFWTEASQDHKLARWSFSECRERWLKWKRNTHILNSHSGKTHVLFLTRHAIKCWGGV